MTKKAMLDELRNRIDLIDRDLLRLLVRRMEISGEVGRSKRGEGISAYQPEREEEVLAGMIALNKGNILSNSALRAIYTEIMSASRALQEPVSVGFLGPEGTFSHIASVRHFGHSIKEVSQKDIPQLFVNVEKGVLDFGVVPVENSMEGTVNASLDMFRHTNVRINAEILLKVVHNLVSVNGQAEDVSRIYSHPQPAAQCRKYLSMRFPDLEVLETQSSAIAAERAASDKKSAAIASEYAAKRFELKKIATHIEDSPNNITRFFVIGTRLSRKSAPSKTSILFSLKDRPGALYKALGSFSKNGINLSKVESRPTREKAWEYIFFIDMDGHAEDKPVKEALDDLDMQARFLKVLGSYPACREVL